MVVLFFFVRETEKVDAAGNAMTRTGNGLGADFPPPCRLDRLLGPPKTPSNQSPENLLPRVVSDLNVKDDLLSA